MVVEYGCEVCCVVEDLKAVKEACSGRPDAERCW